jgi:putative phosphoesterase
MRIVVISDSHKRTGVIDKILSSQTEAKHVFFLGDNIDDIEDFEYLYPDKIFHSVCGNCDYSSLAPSVGLEFIEGKRIFYTHGHLHSVKYGLTRLIETAKNNQYDIVLYGHTHIAKILYEEGIYIVNPGSCSKAREGRPSYAVIDITRQGIMPIIIEV